MRPTDAEGMAKCVALVRLPLGLHLSSDLSVPVLTSHVSEILYFFFAICVRFDDPTKNGFDIVNPFALRKAKIVNNFVRFECNTVKLIKAML